MIVNPLVAPLAAAALFTTAPHVLGSVAVTPLRASLPMRAEAAAPAPPANPDARPTPSLAGRGGVFFVGGGATYLGGSTVQGVQLSALEMSFSIRGGYYVSQHVGIIGGVEFGVGQLTDGCVDGDGEASDKCGSVSARVPVVTELALMDRKHGPYFQAGLALASIHVVSSDRDSVFAMTPAELSLGLGARMPVKYGADVTRTIDIHVRTDVGQATYVSVASDGASASGSVLADRRATHVNTSLVLAVGF